MHRAFVWNPYILATIEFSFSLCSFLPHLNFVLLCPIRYVGSFFSKINLLQIWLHGNTNSMSEYIYFIVHLYKYMCFVYGHRNHVGVNTKYVIFYRVNE